MNVTPAALRLAELTLAELQSCGAIDSPLWNHAARALNAALYGQDRQQIAYNDDSERLAVCAPSPQYSHHERS